jgi:hypothetical protein
MCSCAPRLALCALLAAGACANSEADPEKDESTNTSAGDVVAAGGVIYTPGGAISQPFSATAIHKALVLPPSRQAPI